MRFGIAYKGMAALVIGLTIAGAAEAGGLERGGYDTDLLFDPSRYAFEAGITYVMPDRKLKNVKDVNTTTGPVLNQRSDSARDTSNYGIPYFGIKIGLTDDVDCLVDYSQPFGVHTNPGINWAGANYDVETKLKIQNYGLTCSYKFDAGPGDIRLIGGGFYQQLDGFKEQLVLPAGTKIPLAPGLAYTAPGDETGTLNVQDHGWGWRAGLAYEIPEYAMRASLIYNSQVKYNDISGTVDLTSAPSFLGSQYGVVTPVSGSATAPDSLELKLQSGIAPDWLAFGSVKWTNWSVLQSVPFCARGTASCRPGSAAAITSLDLLYRDGWTFTAGIGHKFNEQWSGAVSLTWDRGTAGTDYGIASDTWTLGAGVSYKPTQHLEFRLAGALGLLTSGHSSTVSSGGVTYGDDATYSYGNDVVGALSTSMKVTF